MVIRRQLLSPRHRRPEPPNYSFRPASGGNGPRDQALVEEMKDNWDQRKGKSVTEDADRNVIPSEGSASSSYSLYSLENIKRDYGGDDIEKLLDSASEIFDSANNNNDFGDPRITDSEFKNKLDGWETTAKTLDGNAWDISQREEDILVQEFERRIAFDKFRIVSFIKTHIFSRRRPIDGWKHMIEEIGPNARKGKGSVSRLATVSDESTQPFREKKPVTFAKSYSSSQGR